MPASSRRIPHLRSPRLRSALYALRWAARRALWVLAGSLGLGWLIFGAFHAPRGDLSVAQAVLAFAGLCVLYRILGDCRLLLPRPPLWPTGRGDEASPVG
jgi:hypothetical protein